MDTSRNKEVGNSNRELELELLGKLNELRSLNNIGASHTKKFIDECSKKKSEIKEELNELVVMLRRTGTKNPLLKRYI